MAFWRSLVVDDTFQREHYKIVLKILDLVARSSIVVTDVSQNWGRAKNLLSPRVKAGLMWFVDVHNQERSRSSNDERKS